MQSWLSSLSNHERIISPLSSSPSSSIYNNTNILLNIKKKIVDINTLVNMKDKEIQKLQLSNIENENQKNVTAVVITILLYIIFSNTNTNTNTNTYTYTYTNTSNLVA